MLPLHDCCDPTASLNTPPLSIPCPARAGELALSGHSVVLYDLRQEQIESARENLFSQMAALVAEGLLQEEEVEVGRLPVWLDDMPLNLFGRMGGK